MPGKRRHRTLRLVVLVSTVRSWFDKLTMSGHLVSGETTGCHATHQRLAYPLAIQKSKQSKFHAIH